MDLSGPWRVAPLTAELNRIGVDPDLDDSHWAEVDVPGHWTTTPELAGRSGPMLYRRAFTHRSPMVGERLWLRLDGVLSTAEVWLDGRYLGDTVGYFAPARFDVTDILRARSQHLLAIDVACPPGGSSRTKSTLTGALQTGPLSPGVNPGGLWRPVSIESTGPVAIRYSRLACVRAQAALATLQIRLVLDAATTGEVVISTTITGPDGGPVDLRAETHTLAAGENRVEWRVDVTEPELWWPAIFGDRAGRPLYRVDVDVSVPTEPGEADTTEPSEADTTEPGETVSWTTGLRSVEMKDLACRVNGRSMFAKTIAYGPAGPYPAAVDPERLRSDARAIKAAGFDMARVYGHVTGPEFYDEADRIGLLIWQDMPLIGGYSSKGRSRIRILARALVDAVGHHPSVAVWCGHTEPNDAVATLPTDPEPDAPLRFGRQLIRHVLPSWNRSLLDPLITRELSNADPSRTVVPRSGTLPTPGQTTDPALWLGWRSSRAEDLAALIRRWPKLGVFPSGIGSQSAAIADWDLDAPDWPSAQEASFARYLPRRAYGDGVGWAMATRAYQADLLRVQIETLRRLKYRPTTGFCVMAWADPEPAGGFGLVDTDRRPKPAHDVVVDACRPVIVVADPPPAVTVPGRELTLGVHAVSDLRHGAGTAIVSATVRAETEPDTIGEPWIHTARWQGQVAADSCTWIGDLTFVTPDVSGPLTIDLVLQTDQLVVSNRYRTVVIPAAEALDGHQRQPKP